MLLFNSNRSNKGKKYIRKADIDAVYARRAEDFNKWFVDKHKLIMYYLIDRNYFDSDAFNECYLKIYDNILFSGLNVDSYKSYFIRSYFTIFQASRVKENRYCEILPVYEKEDFEPDYFVELEEKQKQLENDIMDYIYSNFNIRDFELFKMYMSLKPAVNYATLSKITGVKPHNIQRTISKIKKNIRDNKEFAKRRKEIL